MNEIDKIKENLGEHIQNKKPDHEVIKRNSSGQEKQQTTKTRSGANNSMFFDIESEI